MKNDSLEQLSAISLKTRKNVCLLDKPLGNSLRSHAVRRAHRGSLNFPLKPLGFSPARNFSQHSAVLFPRDATSGETMPALPRDGLQKKLPQPHLARISILLNVGLCPFII